MTTFVIVHGGFGGGWEWSEVAQILRGFGHTVYTPTLTGMGERFHLGPDVGVGTHVQDIVNVLELEDLTDVVLCAASYSGVPATAAADRAADRVSLLVYIDALVPRDGDAALDLLPAFFGEVVRESADARGHGWVEVPDIALPPANGIAEERRARFVSRLRPQPVATFTEPVSLTGAVDGLARAFIRCTGGQLDAAGDPIRPMAERARAEGWLYRELDAPHDPHLFDPEATAAVLDGLAATARRAKEAPTDGQPAGERR